MTHAGHAWPAVPVLGWLVTLLVTLAMVFFGYLAVQSSVNLRDNVQAAVTLLLAAVVNGVLVGQVLSPLVVSPFAGG